METNRFVGAIQIEPHSCAAAGHLGVRRDLALSCLNAFRQLGMEKVYLAFYEGNERGRRAYEKAGYRLEGTLPRDAWRDGRLVTSYLMAAYRDDPLYSE